VYIISQSGSFYKMMSWAHYFDGHRVPQTLHPDLAAYAPQIRPISRWHCARLQIYLLTYLLAGIQRRMLAMVTSMT